MLAIIGRMTLTLTQLFIYPVKACRGIALREALVTETGLDVEGIGDREWVIVDQDLEFLSQRDLPQMALIETRLMADSLRLKAPGMLGLDIPFASEGDVLTVRVWDDEVAAVTQGELADAWVSQFLGQPARLLRFDPEHRRLAQRKYTGAIEAPYKFADAFPLLITTEESLADVNKRLAQQALPAVDQQRFRPNLVLAGLGAYEEDFVRSLSHDTGLQLQAVKPCARCSVPGVDVHSGQYSPVVPDLLASYRSTTQPPVPGVLFGSNAIVAQGAGQRVRIGDVFNAEFAV